MRKSCAPAPLAMFSSTSFEFEVQSWASLGTVGIVALELLGLQCLSFNSGTSALELPTLELQH